MKWLVFVVIFALSLSAVHSQELPVTTSVTNTLTGLKADLLQLRQKLVESEISIATLKKQIEDLEASSNTDEELLEKQRELLIASEKERVALSNSLTRLSKQYRNSKVSSTAIIVGLAAIAVTEFKLLSDAYKK